MVRPGSRFTTEAPFFQVRRLAGDKGWNNSPIVFRASPLGNWHCQKAEWPSRLSTRWGSLHASRKGSEMVAGMTGGLFVREMAPVSQLCCCWLRGSSEQRGFSSSWEKRDESMWLHLPVTWLLLHVNWISTHHAKFPKSSGIKSDM